MKNVILSIFVCFLLSIDCLSAKHNTNKVNQQHENKYYACIIYSKLRLYDVKEPRWVSMCTQKNTFLTPKYCKRIAYHYRNSNIERFASFHGKVVVTSYSYRLIKNKTCNTMKYKVYCTSGFYAKNKVSCVK